MDRLDSILLAVLAVGVLVSVGSWAPSPTLPPATPVMAWGLPAPPVPAPAAPAPLVETNLAAR